MTLWAKVYVVVVRMFCFGVVMRSHSEMHVRMTGQPGRIKE